VDLVFDGIEGMKVKDVFDCEEIKEDFGYGV